MRSIYAWGTLFFLSTSIALIIKFRLFPINDVTNVVVLEQKKDIGHVPYGSDAHAEFHLINQGPSPLKVDEIDTDCGCTVVDWPREVTAIGDTLRVEVKYDKTHQPGFFRQLIQVHANIPEKIKVLVFSGTVDHNRPEP